jgi:hypothetical protein
MATCTTSFASAALTAPDWKKRPIITAPAVFEKMSFFMTFLLQQDSSLKDWP